MDWANERYVRIYTRDTRTWKLLGWEGRAVWPSVIRKLDRSGSMEGVHSSDDLALMIDMPPEVVAPALKRMLSLGVLVDTEDGLVSPNYIEAQETPQSDKQRARESRERKRTKRLNRPSGKEGVVYFVQSETGGPVKIGFAVDLKSRLSNMQTARPDKLILLGSFDGSDVDESRLHRAFEDSRVAGEWFRPTDALLEEIRSVTGCDAIEFRAVTPDARAVTPRHILSHAVTACHSVPSLAVPSLAVPIVCGAEDSTPESRVFGYWAERTGHTRAKLDAKRAKRIRARLKEGLSEDDLRLAIDGAVKDDWLMGRDPRSTKRFDGIETILRDRSQVERLIELAEGEGAEPRDRRRNGSGYASQEAFDHLEKRQKESDGEDDDREADATIDDGLPKATHRG